MSVFTRLRKSQFVTSVAVLATGTLIAQAIQVFASPLLTRIYTPLDFGVFAVFMALISSFIPAVCGKYEVAMVLPKSEQQSKHLLGIAIEVAFVLSLIFLVIIVFSGEWIIELLSTPELSGFIYLAPLVVWLTGVVLAMNYYSNRHSKYKLIARVKIIQAIFVIVISITFGLLGFGVAGLLGGLISGLVFASTFLTFSYRQQLTWSVFKWSRKKTFLLKQYKDFPIYSASSGLLDGVTIAMPIFFLASYFPDSTVGFYALVVRVGNAPLAFLSASVSQVNLRKVVDLVNSGERVRPYLLKVTVVLVGIVLVPTLILVVYSQELFSFVFGSEWREAGLYMQILIPAMAVRFVASTLSSTLGATKNNQLGMIWKVTTFAVTLFIFSWLAPQGDVVALLQAVMMMDIALYIFYYSLIWKAAGSPRNIAS